MARHPNQKIPTYSLKKAIETGQFDRVEYLIETNIPQYILKNIQYNTEGKRDEM